jgi:hypothetical protein
LRENHVLSSVYALDDDFIITGIVCVSDIFHRLIILMEKYELSNFENKESGEKFIAQVKNAILERYPFYSPEQRAVFECRVNGVSPENAVYDLQRVIAGLENTHTFLKERSKNFFLERPIFHKAGLYWVNHGNHVSEVVEIDGVSIDTLVGERMDFIGGGTYDFKIQTALQDILMSDTAHDVLVGVKSDTGEILHIPLRFISREELSSQGREKVVDGKILAGNIGYLKIKSWSKDIVLEGKTIGDMVDDTLHSLEGTDALIIDVRENGGGDSRQAEMLAGRFIREPVRYATAFRRVAGVSDLVADDFVLAPQGDFLDKKVVILTGPKCLSSNELFIMMMKDGIGIPTIGERTGGGSGNPVTFPLNLFDKEYIFKVSTWSIKRKNGMDLENVGIEPNVPVTIRSDDVMGGKDPAVEAARQHFLSVSHV